MSIGSSESLFSYLVRMINKKTIRKKEGKNVSNNRWRRKMGDALYRFLLLLLPNSTHTIQQCEKKE